MTSKNYIRFLLLLCCCCLLSLDSTATNCYNCTNPGQIGYNQSGCSPFDPASIQNLQSASGGSGTLEYRWYYKNSTTGGSYVSISNSNSSSYNPGPITETTYYKRKAKRIYCSDWKETNIITVTITQCCNADITSLKVFDINNSSHFLTLTNLGIYDATTFPANWNIEAIVTGTTAESVKFTITGSASSSNIENTTPFRTPGDAVALNWGAGTYTINAKVFSADNAGGQECDEKTITITLTQAPCLLNVNAGTDVSLCTTTKILTATSTGASSCSTQVIVDCNNPIANSGGWLADLSNSTVCGDNAGTKLWTQGGNGTSYITLDLGSALAAGTQICVNMKLEHCSNTSSSYSNAKIQASTSASSGFVNLKSSETFSHTSYQEYCYTLAAPARYIRITDNGNCALRVDYVKSIIPGTTNSAVTYSWTGPGIVGATNTAAVTVNQTGIYIVTATDCKGCVDKDTLVVSSCCILDVNAGTDVSSCSATSKILTATSTGASTCSTQVITDCNHPLANSGGWLADISNSSVCGDNAGTKLWTKGGNGTSYITLDLGSALAAGTQICVNMKLEHCSNTSSGFSNAKIQASTSSNSGFVNLVSSVTFSHTTYQEYCYTLASSARYIKILDNGDCALRVDYVKYTIPGTSNSTVTYSWSGPGIVGATNTASITVNQHGTYIVTATDCKGCIDYDTVKYTVITPPVCDITGGNSCCNGGTVQLCAPAGYASYLWNTGATSACVNVGAGSYTVTVTDANGCSNTCYKTVTPHQPPSCDITGGNSCCNGGTVQLCAPAGYASYLWNTGATSACVNVGAGSYTVTVTDANGCSNTCYKTVLPNQPPSCDITGGNSCCNGGTVQLCAPAGYASYLWNTGATSACVNVGAGSYTVTVTDANGCSNTCYKTVLPNQPPSCDITGGNSCCNGGTVQLCAPAGYASYLWNTGATSACINVGAGSYTVTVTDANGCSNTCYKTVTPHQPPSCDITGGNSCCNGGTVQLCAPAGYASYLWNTGATSACVNVGAGSYTVTVTDANGCSNTCYKTVTPNQPPSCDITGGNSCCNGGTVQLCAPAGYASYLWNTGATSACINVGAGSYTVTVTDANGCSNTCYKTVLPNQPPSCDITGNNIICDADSAYLCGPAGYTYSWSTGETTQCIYVKVDGIVTLTIKDANNCTSTCTKYVYVTTIPTIYMPPFGTVCDTVTAGITLSGATPIGGTYYGTGVIGGVFYPALAGVGTHWIKYTYSVNQCSATDSASIVVVNCLCISPTPPQIEGPGVVCAGGGQYIYTAVGSVGATSYFWTVPAGVTIITGQGTATLTVTFTATCQPGNICVRASNPCADCNNVCKAFTLISTAPTPGVISGTVVGVCPGTSYQYCIAAVAGADEYLWTVPVGTTIAIGQGTTCITIDVDASFVSGTISVKSKNCKGYSSARTLAIRKLALQPGVMTGPVSNLCNGINIDYSIASVAGATSYLWVQPVGANIVSGQGTTAIKVNFLPGFISGPISVYAVNACGNSIARTLQLKSKPATPVSITGASPVCGGSLGIPYSVASEIGVMYNWTAPAGSNIAGGQSSANVTVNFGAASGNLSVIPSNACGSSPAATKAVTVQSCTRFTLEEEIAVKASLSVYPNPVRSDLTLDINSEKESNYTVTVTDIIGKVMFSDNLNAVAGNNKKEINVRNLAEGIYIITVKGNDFNKSIRITVE